MDSAGSCGGSTDVGAAYEATMARRARDQERLEGAQATRLIDAAAAPTPTVLPSDATFSVRV
ncbi:MAG: hypothetical protein ABJA82_09110 [Myxococcales bacterium]